VAGVTGDARRAPGYVVTVVAGHRTVLGAAGPDADQRSSDLGLVVRGRGSLVAIDALPVVVQFRLTRGEIADLGLGADRIDGREDHVLDAVDVEVLLQVDIVAGDLVAFAGVAAAAGRVVVVAPLVERAGVAGVAVDGQRGSDIPVTGARPGAARGSRQVHGTRVDIIVVDTDDVLAVAAGGRLVTMAVAAVVIGAVRQRGREGPAIPVRGGQHQPQSEPWRGDQVAERCD